MRTRLHLLAGLALSVLAACGARPDWNAQPLPPGMPGLAFELTGESGAALRAEDLAGRVVLLAFGYTACPDVCPSTLARLRAALARLPEEMAARCRVLFVSVDPRRDGPARLERYTAAFGERFLGATGPEPRLRRLTERMGLSFAHGEAGGDGFHSVSHPSGVFVFDAGGRPRLLVDAAQGPEAIAADLQRLVAASPS